MQAAKKQRQLRIRDAWLNGNEYAFRYSIFILYPKIDMMSFDMINEAIERDIGTHTRLKEDL